MTATLQQSSRHVGPPADTKSRKPASRGVKRRAPVDGLLPPSVIDQLRSRAVQATSIEPALVRELDADLAIEARYGVSRRRLGSYLRRLHRDGDARANQKARLDGRDGGDLSSAELHGHRIRQASVASILDATFGGLAQSSPDLWDRRAYLMLVGLVYERLATNQADIPTDELVALAKVLAEGRRADARTKEANRPPDREHTEPVSDTPLPGHFCRIIRQVYGANLQDPTSSGDDSES